MKKMGRPKTVIHNYHVGLDLSPETIKKARILGLNLGFKSLRTFIASLILEALNKK